MAENFNALTPAEHELLAWLSEECGEVVQAIGKILRHGLETGHPGGGHTNRQCLEKELGDVRAAMTALMTQGIINGSVIQDWCMMKLENVRPYLHHAELD